MRLLLVEDDRLLGEGIEAGLAQEGYEVEWVTDGAGALRAVGHEGFDLMVLDLGLPDRDGLDVLREMRDQGHPLAVLVLTARDTVRDRVAGLDVGADDYLVKPFDLEELAARLRAIIRRRGGRGTTARRHGALTLDPATSRVSLRGERVDLTRSEFAVLSTLLENAGKVLSRAELEAALHGWGEGLDSNAIEVHIHHLRRKLDRDLIRTVRGVGYIVDRLSRRRRKPDA